LATGKPAPKPAPSSTASTTKPAPAKPGKVTKAPPKTTPGVAEPSVRRQVAGGPTTTDVAVGVESPELKALREAERELFPPALPQYSPWPSELPSPIPREGAPMVHTSGLPPAPIATAPPLFAEGGRDLKWLVGLQMPDLPVRWEPRLVRYLELYKDDPRAHAAMGYWLRRSGRYRDVVRKTLRQKGLPEDIFWLSMIESGFDPTARSPAGAVGLWQFMGETGRQYGLPQDRWVDHRLDVVAATSSAADFLADLHRRFGSWELAMAAYNMGYGGLTAVVRRYNTNDFWALSKLEGSLPWETTLYVPKIVAAAIVAKNPAAFGFGDFALDPALEFEEVGVPPGTSLSAVAQAAGVSTKDVEVLNPELRASRTPPRESEGDRTYPVKVPVGKGAMVTAGLAKAQKNDVPLERYVVRFGESLDQIAQARGTTAAKLVEINAVAPGEVVRGGMVLLVPFAKSGADKAGAPVVATVTGTPSDKPPAVVPADVFVYPGRKRVFYRVTTGDTLPEIASALKVGVDDLRRWNDVDPTARLVEGMTLQAFVPDGTDLSKVVTLAESDVRVVPVGSDEFFALTDALKGKKRVPITAKAGETLESIGKRWGVSIATMERINRRGRSEPIKDGDTIVVWSANASGAPTLATSTPDTSALPSPDPLGPLPVAPRPDLRPDAH
jgi:membrane-bound lytic murein transglycosylase D